MALTNVQAKNAKPRANPYKIADGGGMFLLICPNAAKYWRLKYRFGGKEKLLALGVYPEVSVDEARKRRERAREILRGGADPAQAKHEKKLLDKLSAANTFEAIAREWHENKRDGWEDRTAADKLNRLEKDVFPFLGPRQIASITPKEVLVVLRKVESRGALEMTRRLKQVIGQVFRYAVAIGHSERDPTQDLKDALKPVKPGHFAAIEPNDLGAFLWALNRNEARLFAPTRIAMRLMLLTFVRTSELIEARWKEFDLDGGLWDIPAARMKMRRPHRVPLSSQAVAALRELQDITGRNDFLFPNQRNHERPMSNGAILAALKRMGYKGRMTGHGFRALAMTTIKERLRYRHEVIDMQLAHAKENKVQAAYDRAQFLEERIEMMQAWADYLGQVSKGAEIVPLRAA